MSKLVFKLRAVPDDEAKEVRELLESNHIEFYETTAGNWGIAMPGLWVQDDDVHRCRTLIDEYQLARAEHQRQQYIESIARGEHLSWYDIFLRKPWATAGTVLFCLFIVYAILAPFIRLAAEK